MSRGFMVMNWVSKVCETFGFSDLSRHQYKRVKMKAILASGICYLLLRCLRRIASDCWCFLSSKLGHSSAILSVGKQSA